MAFQWKDYYELAVKLRTEGGEACLRCAISRVYYSVFHQAKDLMEEENGPIRVDETSVHKKLWTYFKCQGGPTNAAVGINGDRLSRNRAQGDYNLTLKDDLSSLVQDSFIKANNILQNIAAINKAKNRPGRIS